MSKAGRNARRKAHKAQQGNGNHKAKTNSDGTTQALEAKDKAAKDKTADLEAQAKAANGEVSTTRKGGAIVSQDIVSKDTGEPILTNDDKGRLKALKTAQDLESKARRLKAEAIQTAKDAQAKAKEALEALDSGGSKALTILREDAQGKVNKAQAVVNGLKDTLQSNQEAFDKSQESIKAELETSLEELQTCYEQARQVGLMIEGKDKSKGKSKGNSKAQTAGRFTSPKEALCFGKGKREIEASITHKPTGKVFAFALPVIKGKIAHTSWLRLRHEFIAWTDELAPLDSEPLNGYDSYNHLARAYLSGLKARVQRDYKPVEA